MTTKEFEKLVATALVTGTLVTAASLGINKPNCDYILLHEEKEICVSNDVKNMLESELEISKGFGGIRFNQK
jgi:hypothetical protein